MTSEIVLTPAFYQVTGLSSGDISLIVAIIAAVTGVVSAILVWKGKKDVSGDKTVDEETEIRRELRVENKEQKVEIVDLKAQITELKKQNALLTEQNERLMEANDVQASALTDMKNKEAVRDLLVTQLNDSVLRLTSEITQLKRQYDIAGEPTRSTQ